MKEANMLSIGNRVRITDEGVRAHLQYHDAHVNAVAKVSMPLKTVAEVTKQVIFTFPELGCKGSIVEVKRRWWGQSGYDYLVRWDNGSGQSWHLSRHLLLSE